MGPDANVRPGLLGSDANLFRDSTFPLIRPALGHLNEHVAGFITGQCKPFAHFDDEVSVSRDLRALATIREHLRSRPLLPSPVVRIGNPPQTSEPRGRVRGPPFHEPYGRGDGFAHGFVVLSDSAIFSYKVDNYYASEYARGIVFDDAHLEIDWKLPIELLKLSAKDKILPKISKEINYFNSFQEGIKSQI